MLLKTMGLSSEIYKDFVSIIKNIFVAVMRTLERCSVENMDCVYVNRQTRSPERRTNRGYGGPSGSSGGGPGGSPGKDSGWGPGMLYHGPSGYIFSNRFHESYTSPIDLVASPSPAVCHKSP
ncbi:hypothetical protein Hamer_G006533 [Homarus americanus]|uniref:Uncharacterized protein n=1 Tax=Homarus americanus TaxID=6706 RepID=A0A8J5JDS2_HOMAM|nr:hypothetical protein Hamer_G006533 [Homarus americanus]